MNVVPTDPTRHYMWHWRIQSWCWASARVSFWIHMQIFQYFQLTWVWKQKWIEVEINKNFLQDIVFSTAKGIRRQKRLALRRIRLQITVGKSFSDSLMDWTFSLSLFVFVFCFSFFLFCPRAFHFQKDISHLPALPITTYMAAHSIFMPVSKNTSRAVTRRTNSNPNLAHLALAAAFHRRGEGVLPANQSSSRRHRSRADTLARLGRELPGSDTVAHTPAVWFRSRFVPFVTMRHGASRGCACLSRVSWLALYPCWFRTRSCEHRLNLFLCEFVSRVHERKKEPPVLLICMFEVDSKEEEKNVNTKTSHHRVMTNVSAVGT